MRIRQWLTPWLGPELHRFSVSVPACCLGRVDPQRVIDAMTRAAHAEIEQAGGCARLPAELLGFAPKGDEAR